MVRDFDGSHVMVLFSLKWIKYVIRMNEECLCEVCVWRARLMENVAEGDHMYNGQVIRELTGKSLNVH